MKGKLTCMCSLFCLSEFSIILAYQTLSKITTLYHFTFQIIKATDLVFHTGRVCHVWCNLIQLYVSDYHHFWNIERQLSENQYSLQKNSFSYKRSVLQNGVNALSKMILKLVFFFFWGGGVKNLTILDYTIWLKF